MPVGVRRVVTHRGPVYAAPSRQTRPTIASARIEIAFFGGRVGADVEPGRPVDAVDISDAAVGQPVGAGLLHLPSAKRTDVARVAVERGCEGRPRELEVVCRDDDLVERRRRGDEAVCGSRLRW